MIETNKQCPSLYYNTNPFLTPLSFAFFKADITMLRSYLTREDVDSYVIVLKKVLCLFGLAIHESLTRTLGNFLEATCGTQANKHKTEWEKDIASRMVCTNNGAESPFATVRAFLHIYPRLPDPNLDPTLPPALTTLALTGTLTPTRTLSLTLTLTRDRNRYQTLTPKP
jgi:hypothetical protein